MSIKSRGFVLFMVLLFLQLFSALSLLELSDITLSVKINRERWQTQAILLKANNLLSQLEKQVMVNKPACPIPLMTTEQLRKQPLTWWQQVACGGNLGELRYYYAIETLAKNSCARAIGANAQAMTVFYYRINLLALNNISLVPVILQSTVAVASDDVPACKDIPESVQLGRQMRREFRSKIMEGDTDAARELER